MEYFFSLKKIIVLFVCFALMGTVFASGNSEMSGMAEGKTVVSMDAPDSGVKHSEKVVLNFSSTGGLYENERNSDDAGFSSGERREVLDAAFEKLKNEAKNLNDIFLRIDGKDISVKWENNSAFDALKKRCKKNPVKIKMSEYGGFEQTGLLGFELPRDDKQMKTSAGDIVLYNGNQISVFYGENRWSYTLLGRIVSMSRTELENLLSSSNVEIVFY